MWINFRAYMQPAPTQPDTETFHHSTTTGISNDN